MVHFKFHDGITFGEFTRMIRQCLAPKYGEGEAKAMALLMIYNLKGWNQTDLIINSDREVSEYIAAKVDEFMDRLDRDEPIQYILGEASFYGMMLRVNPSVLIPRQETEELVDLIVKGNKESDLKVLDIGTGSGAIAIALCRNLRFPEVSAIDISADALAVARENAQLLHAKIKFMRQDVFTYEPQDAEWDIIVSNPPYIAQSEAKDMEANVLDYEPHTALFVPDEDPLVYYSRIAEIASSGLRQAGRLYLEINPHYASQLKSMLESDGFKEVSLVKDISGKMRFACAKK